MIVGYIATLLITLAYTPQLIKTLKSRRVEGLSVYTSTLLVTGLIFWCFYAFKNKDIPLFISSFISLTQNLVLIILYFKYVKKNT